MGLSLVNSVMKSQMDGCSLKKVSNSVIIRASLYSLTSAQARSTSSLLIMKLSFYHVPRGSLREREDVRARRIPDRLIAESKVGFPANRRSIGCTLQAGPPVVLLF